MTQVTSRVIILFLLIVLVDACTQFHKNSHVNEAAVGLPVSMGKSVYEKQCSYCHGEARFGSMGPALIPESLLKIKKEDARQTISEGRRATQMPAFKEKLSVTELNAVLDYIYSPMEKMPDWGIQEIKSSHKILIDFKTLSDKPVYKADPLNLFLVVEHADHHVSVLDGDKLEVLDRFLTPIALHGGIKYSQDGRYAYLASRDGWIDLYDVYNLKLLAEVRVGVNTRNIAISGDGKYLIAANYLPQNLVVLDAKTLSPIKVIPALSKQGHLSRVSAVYTAPNRESFIVALKDAPEIWEMSYREDAKAPYTGLVHDYRAESGESLETPKEFLPIKRILLEGATPLDDFFFDTEYKNVLGASRKGEAWVVNLIVGKPTYKIEMGGMPHLGSGINWREKGHNIIASPNLLESEITLIDTEKWKIQGRVALPGPAFFMRSHENTPYAWIDTMGGKEKDNIIILNKHTKKIVKALKPVPGKTVGHAEFSRDGKKVLISVWAPSPEGAILVYDAKTFKLIKSIPMNAPAGKYNIYNKIHYSEGTSH